MTDVSRWAVEMIAAEGRCAINLLYSRNGAPATVWASVSWTLPDVPLTADAMLNELYDGFLCLLEELAS